jgi:Asp-tRNA(Asn)/Glu-tRNA(Gln) amidotransferase A subunit family amidase
MTDPAQPDPLLAAVLAACDRIEREDRAIRAFVAEPGRRARVAEQAAAVRLRWPDAARRPALFGVPAGVKDVIRVDGLPIRAGSQLPPDVLHGAQAEVVTRLLAAGAIVAGQTATAEFAVLAPGPTRNPRELRHTPGGSSSGSAAAVAAGMVPLALGTQTIASVIRPAAYCGVAGFRPTYGRVPAAGVIAFAPSLDTVGWFAPEVAGLTRAAGVLCDRWRPSGAAGTAARSAGMPVLGVPSGPYLEQASPEALAAFAAQVELLRAAGFPVREVPVLADLDHILRQLFVITRYELTRGHASWFRHYGELYRPETATAIRQGKAVGRSEHAAALTWLAAFRSELAEAMEAAAIEAWITPAATGPAPASLASTGDPAMSVPWSLAGLPAVSLPAGLVAGLPVGLQCAGSAGADEQLLRAAALIETALAA